MNLDELRSVQSKERKKDSLQNLRPSFYQEVGEYIADLEDEREHVAEQVDDPFSSPEIGHLTDEIETAKDVVEAIYERRMGKLVKQASLAAAGMAADDEGLTAEEADLFDDLVDRIGANKSRVLDVLEGVETDVASEVNASAATEAGPDDVDMPDDSEAASTRPVPDDGVDDVPPDEPEIGAEPPSPASDTTDDTPPVPPQEPPADAASSAGADGSASESTGPSGVTPADVMGGDGPTVDDTPPEPPSDSPPTSSESESETDTKTDDDDTDAVDRVTVKITQDIGSILGVDDREYTLSTDDVVTLPAQNATPLVERDAAEPLE
ncbi:DNA replication complex subunit Gins51 [Natronorubrum aibiense]|uniref:Gins51 C-terminal domain-containing protein n=1 Tax=Natronorubrum aibiense TaxID=348826 RepID=A0A5P9NZ64_9EURY|nr:hypothetical protein [Natronorubrum aibiense]QFU81056.1 hypothetical protein GCU68_00025 [Natronorubrum aibiense]